MENDSFAASDPKSSSSLGTWLPIFGISMLAAVVVAVVVMVFMPPRYSSATTVLLSEAGASGSALASLAEKATGLSSSSSGLSPARIEAILRSQRIRKEVLALSNTTAILRKDQSEYLPWLAKATRILKQPGGQVAVEVTCQGPSRLAVWTGNAKPDTQQVMELAALISNSYIVALRSYLREVEKGNVEFIRQRLTEADLQVRGLDQELQEFRLQNDIIDPTSTLEVMTSRERLLAELQTRSAADAAASDTSYRSAEARLTKQDTLRVGTIISGRNPLLTSLSQKLADQELALVMARDSGRKAGHPEVVELQQQVAATRRELARVTEDVQTQVSKEVDPNYDALTSRLIASQIARVDAEVRRDRYASELREVRQQLRKLPAVMREYVDLTARRELKATVLVSLAQKLELASLDEKRQASDKFQVLDEARIPEEKSGPSTTRSAVAAFLLCFVSLSVMALRRTLLLQVAPRD